MARNNCEGPSIIAFADRAAMAARIGDLVTQAICAGLGAAGKANLMVSGGSTPADLYADLSSRLIDWQNVNIALVDERWVAPGQDGSNETFVRQTLLQNQARKAKFEGLWNDAPSPDAGLGEAEKRFNRPGLADVVILGMGNDGHTASWFPRAVGLERALEKTGPSLAAIRAKKSDVTGDHLERITMTLKAVSAAPLVILMLSGAQKKATYLKACSEGSIDDMPVRAIMRARPDMWVCWAP